LPAWSRFGQEWASRPLSRAGADGVASSASARRRPFFGIGAPKNTPAEIVERLNKEINAALADPKARARLAEMGGMIFAGSPADFGKLVVSETEKWAKVVKSSGMKPE
jgi:tripartite-type tricarboxylate transporter receptor subunit TctC